MNEYQQFKAKTVDEAITKAMEELQTSTDFLEYEIVDRGTTGFLGIGARPAIINARKKEEIPSEEKKSSQKPGIGDANVKTKKDNQKKDSEKENVPSKNEALKENKASKPEKSNSNKEQKKEEIKEEIKEGKKEDQIKQEEKKPVERKAIDVTPLIPKAEKFLKDVFEAMKISAEIKVAAGEDVNSIDVEISGDDMGVLIGKRGQTLDSLQYLTSIIVNAGQEEYVRVKVDTENYRSRRKETLENLAHNVAAKVKKTNHTVALEPMNPYERRVIHSALQQDKYVDTHSEGEEPYRKVVITPNKNCRNYSNGKSYGNRRYHKNNK